MAREPDCIEVVELVTAYLEGALPPDEREAFELHLGKCTACGYYVEQIRLTIEQVGRVDPDALPAATRAGLLAAFREWRTP